MSDFWARKLGQQPQQYQQQQNTPRPVAPAPRPWWDTTPHEQAVQQVMTQPVQEEYKPHQAKSARIDDTCPECFSGNYMAPPGTNAQKRCFDCGHPYQQTGSQGVQTKGGAPATPARQIHDGSSNYDPGNIIGRVS